MYSFKNKESPMTLIYNRNNKCTNVFYTGPYVPGRCGAISPDIPILGINAGKWWEWPCNQSLSYVCEIQG